MLARAFAFDIPPVTLAFIRWSAALCILLPFCLPAIIRSRQLIIKEWKVLSLFGVLSVASFNTLAYVGLQTTTALNGTFLQSFMPIMILLLNAMFLGQKATLKQWCGVFTSLVGVLVLVCQGQWDIFQTLSLQEGDVWVITALLIWAIYSVLLRYRPEHLSPLPFLGVLVIVGVCALAPMSFFEMQYEASIQWNSDLYLMVAFLAVFPSVLAYLFWNRGVAELGAAKAGLFIHLVPVWGLLLSTIFLGEEVQPFHLLSIGLIFIGIYLAVVSSTLGQPDQNLSKEQNK